MPRPALAAFVTAVVTALTLGAPRAEAAPSSPCAALTLDPARVRVATSAATELRARGGSGHAVFSLEGATRGARIEAGGGLRAGDSPASFTAVARDDACGAEARAAVDVVGPFDVSPRLLRLPPLGSARLEARGALGAVSFTILDGPTGAGRAATLERDGTFRAGEREGTYRVRARDGESGREIASVVEVARGMTPLRPRSEILAVPGGGRVRLAWAGGSGSVDASVAETSGARLVAGADDTWLEAPRAPGVLEVRGVDRVTRAVAIQRIAVGRTLGAPPIARGTGSGTGDLASGDVNGDGLADLVVGHSERSKNGLEAGGVLVFYGTPKGYADAADVVLEGERAGDRFGATLLVRDMNGDGVDDVVVGSPELDLGESDRGAVAIYLGGARGLSTTPDRVLNGEDAGHRFGTALLAEDLDGDGAPELVVSAPGARSVFARACEGGRVYVYRGQPGARGVVEPFPWQTLDLRDPLSDVDAPVACAPSPLGAGRSLALIDLDEDHALDLVVGAPRVSYPLADRAHGAIEIYRGSPSGTFGATPAWSIHLDPSERRDGAAFGTGLDVVGEAYGPTVLVVRSAAYGAKGPRSAAAPGALWTFAPGTLGAPLLSPLMRVRVLTTRIARARYVGAAPDEGVGRSGALVDLEGSGKITYAVGCASPGGVGRVALFGAGAVARAVGTLRPEAWLDAGTGDLAGDRLAAVRGADGVGDGLVLLAPGRTTREGPVTGAVDVMPPAVRSPLATRWAQRRALALPAFGASDRAGSAVALGALGAHAKDGPILALVGAPGAHSAAAPGASPPRLAGDHLRTGAVDAFAGDPRHPVARASVDRDNAQLGAGAVVTLDFDGDGALDLAVGDPGDAPAASVAEGAADPASCLGAGDAAAPAVRGMVRVYALVGGALVERFRVVGSAAPARGGARFGSALAAADVNGDGKDDLVVGRPGARDASGAEVVLGRAADPSRGVRIACSAGERGASGATVFPSATPEEPVAYGAAVAPLGDLDGDGCAEIAVSMSRGAFPGSPARAGIAVAFGYDPSGARCRGHKSPFVLRVVPDDHALGDDVPGDAARRSDDVVDLRGAPTGMGGVLARSSGDVTGDGVPDLVFRDADLAVGDGRGPAIEVISGAWLARLCPARVCPRGRAGPLWADGEWRVVGLRAVGFPERRVLAARPLESRFASAIAIADLDGDGIGDVSIGVPDGASGAPFAGELRVYRGGPRFGDPRAPPPDPWLVAVGEPGERSAVGASVAALRRGGETWLLVGAPASNRGGAGGGVGAAYEWRIADPAPGRTTHGAGEAAR